MKQAYKSKTRVTVYRLNAGRYCRGECISLYAQNLHLAWMPIAGVIFIPCVYIEAMCTSEMILCELWRKNRDKGNSLMAKIVVNGYLSCERISFVKTLGLHVKSKMTLNVFRIFHFCLSLKSIARCWERENLPRWKLFLKWFDFSPLQIHRS